MFERFTDKGRKIIILAREEAERHQNDYLGTEHLVLAILRESDGIALMILKKMGLSTEQIRLEIERNLPGGGTTMTFGEIPFSPRVKKVIEYGVEEARLLQRVSAGEMEHDGEQQVIDRDKDDTCDQPRGRETQGRIVDEVRVQKELSGDEPDSHRGQHEDADIERL